jgi:hypothetical protein
MSFWRPRVHLGSLVVLTLVLGGYVGLNVIPDPPLQVRLHIIKGDGPYYGWPVAYGFRFIPFGNAYTGNDVTGESEKMTTYFIAGMVIDVVVILGVLHLIAFCMERKDTSPE